MSRLSCAQVRRALGEARAADLPAHARAAVEEHLASCEACRQEAAAFDLLGRVLAERRAATHAPEDFASAVMSRVASREAGRARRWLFPAFDPRRLKPALALAVVAVLVLTFSAVYLHHGPSGPNIIQSADASQSFVDGLVLSHQDLASTNTGADAGVLVTRYSPDAP